MCVLYLDPKNVIPFGVLTDAHLAGQLKIIDPPSVALVRTLNDSLVRINQCVK